VGQPLKPKRFIQPLHQQLRHQLQLARRLAHHRGARLGVWIRSVSHLALIRNTRAFGLAPRGSSARLGRNINASISNGDSAHGESWRPMFGDYYTNDLLSRSPKTEMLGNQIDYYINNSSQPQRGAILVLMLSVLLLIGLSWYLRSTAKIGKEQVR
jgi:hypothetical protein